MFELSHIQERDPFREKLAEAMAEFERVNGPIQTLPIRIGEAPVEQFTIHSPGKPKSLPSSSQALRAKDHDRITVRQKKMMANIAKVRELAAQGLTIEEMAEQSGFSRKYVMRLMREHNIVRKPRMDLEGQ